MSKTTSHLRTSQKIYLPFKRFFDIVFSIIGIIVCSILLWWWVLLVNTIICKGHPFFKQYRIGKNEKPFKLIKFRTMKLEYSSDITGEFTYITSEMTTKFGRFLRKTSIDETPQLINIFLGSMSFIGPRPLIVDLDEYTNVTTLNIRRENHAIELKPGLSGLAQIKGRSGMSSITRGNYDGEYFQKLSFFMDIKIFFYTIFHIFGKLKG